MPRHVLKIRLGCSRKRLGMLQKRPVSREFRKHHHLHPWIEMHGEVNALPHGSDIRPMNEVHLNARNGKWFHDVTISKTGREASSSL